MKGVIKVSTNRKGERKNAGGGREERGERSQSEKRQREGMWLAMGHAFIFLLSIACLPPTLSVAAYGCVAVCVLKEMCR